MMVWLAWLAGAAAVLFIGSTLALWSYGRFARRARGPESAALPLGEDAPLDRLIAPYEAAAPGQSGAALVIDNLDAFARRLASAAQAQRSLDLMYYIWRDDHTGRLLAEALLDAADRGVRVRMLLDDVNVLGLDPTYLALDGHPGIEVRLFNPIRARRSSIRHGLEMLFSLLRYNRRMHGKLWIADGRLALIGGRNIGDVYFDAARGRLRRNVRDIDLLLAGPVLRDAETMFDAYWNSGLALPIAALWKPRRFDVDGLRATLRRNRRSGRVRSYLSRIGSPGEEATLGLQGLDWAEGYRFVADPPEKASGTGREGWMPDAIEPLMHDATRRIDILTPYFVPGREGMAVLVGAAARGVEVRVITNTLAVTNHLIVHGAYRRYRRALLSGRVQLFEYAPSTKSGPMHHGKAFVIDGRLGFVGSFNFDLRSVFLNTELGVVFESPALLAVLETELARSRAPERAYRLSLSGRRLSWARGTGQSIRHEPGTGAARRAASFLIGHLPIHRWL
jgi:cardiolipin synthase C